MFRTVLIAALILPLALAGCGKVGTVKTNAGKTDAASPAKVYPPE